MNLEKENLIKTLYERGYTIQEIKNQAQCSSDSINKVRDKYNLPKRGKNLSRKFNNFAALFGNLEDKSLDELQENVENLQPSQPLTKLEGSTTNS